MKKALFLLGLLFVANGMSHFLFGQNNGEPIVLEYQDYKFFNDEPDYKLLEKQVAWVGFACKDLTPKLYALDEDKQTVIEYDLKDALNNNIKKRTFRLSSKVEALLVRNESNMKISPNGQRLAFVDEGGSNLHVVDISTGNEIALCKLGDDFDNIEYDPLGRHQLDFDGWGHPFAFLSDNEVLLSGASKAMIYNIDRKRSSKLTFDKKWNTIPKSTVSSNGAVSGMLFKHNSKGFEIDHIWVTFFVENGKIKNTIEGLEVHESPFYTHYWYSNWYSIDKMNGHGETYCRRTGEKMPSGAYLYSDNNAYYIDDLKNLRFVNLQSSASKYTARQQEIMKKYMLRFSSKYKYGWYWKGWIQDNQILGYFDGEKLVLFNHTLTDNEIAKQALLAAVNSKKIEDFDRFIADFGDSRYVELAKQKRNECITNTSLQDAIAYLKNCSNPDYREAVENEVVANKVKDLASATSCLDNYPQLSTKLENKMLGYVNSINDYETFVKYYPTKKASPELDDRLYQLVSQTYEENDLNYYLRVFPDGRHKSEATAEVNEIACYFAAKNGGKAECTTYLTKYPNGQFVSEIKIKKEVLVGMENTLAQIKKNSNKGIWKLGNKLCNCTENGFIMATLDQWNEDHSSFKGIIVASPGGQYKGDILQKGSAIWFDTDNWHICLDMEVDAALKNDKSLNANLYERLKDINK
ncbi:MAG: hypothetical protein IKT08_09400 [Bacteroidales bacterium]|nr:hypothetical protein [Bacteroidales bacterium]